MNDTQKFEKQSSEEIDRTGWISDALINRTDERNRAAILEIHSEHWDLFSEATGSSHNHQAWRGGYLEHIRQVNLYAAHLYSLWLDLGVLASLPEEECFSLEEVLTVTTLHDIEKPFRTIIGPDGLLIRNPELVTKQQRDDFKWKFLERHGIKLNTNQLNAMRYVEGFDSDYTPLRRVIGPLGAIAHAADLISARGSYNFNNPGSVVPVL